MLSITGSAKSRRLGDQVPTCQLVAISATPHICGAALLACTHWLSLSDVQRTCVGGLLGLTGCG
jgi:hypothetical protein